MAQAALRNVRCEEKMYIPLDKYPDYNFKGPHDRLPPEICAD